MTAESALGSIFLWPRFQLRVPAAGGAKLRRRHFTSCRAWGIRLIGMALVSRRCVRGALGLVRYLRWMPFYGRTLTLPIH